MIPPFLNYRFPANSAVFQVPKKTSKSFVLDKTRKKGEKFAILPNSQVEHAQSTQLDQVTGASEKPDVRKRSRQAQRSEISSNDSTQFIHNFIERVQSHDPNTSFGLLTFKQVPVKNVRVIYGSEESRQYKPILPKNKKFTKVLLTDVQVADIDTNILSSTRQNELPFKRVTLMSVFGGNVGSSSMLNESINSTIASDFSAENSSTNQVASSEKDRQKFAKTRNRGGFIKPKLERSPEIFSARKFSNVYLNKSLINWPYEPKNNLPKSKSLLGKTCIEGSILRNSDSDYVMSSDDSSNDSEDDFCLSQIKKIHMSNEKSSNTFGSGQLRNSIANDVMTSCESDDDLRLSVIKNRINRTGRFLQQKSKVDDNLFGYTYAKLSSNRVEKDYSLYYRKVHSRKPQREFPDNKKEKMGFEIRIYPDVVVDENAPVDSSVPRKRVQRLNRPGKFQLRQVECPPDCYCWRDGMVDDSNETAVAAAPQPPKRRITTTKLESYSRMTSCPDSSTAVAGEENGKDNCVPAKCFTDTVRKKSIGVDDEESSNCSPEIFTQTSELLQRSGLDQRSQLNKRSQLDQSRELKQRSQVTQGPQLTKRSELTQESELTRSDLSDCEEAMAINRSSRNKLRVSRLLSSESEISDCEAMEPSAVSVSENCKMEDSVRTNVRKKVRPSRLLSSDSEDSECEMNVVSVPVITQNSGDKRSFETNQRKQMKTSRVLPSANKMFNCRKDVTPFVENSSQAFEDPNSVKIDDSGKSRKSALSPNHEDLESEMIENANLEKCLQVCEAEESQPVCDNCEESDLDLNYDSDVSSSSSIVFDHRKPNLFGNGIQRSVLSDDDSCSNEEFNVKSSNADVLKTFQETEANCSTIAIPVARDLSNAESTVADLNVGETGTGTFTSLLEQERSVCHLESDTRSISEQNQSCDSDNENDFETVFDSNLKSDELLRSYLANSSMINCDRVEPENLTERNETISGLEHSLDTSTNNSSPELVASCEDKENINNNKLQCKYRKQPIMVKKCKRKASFIDSTFSQSKKVLKM